MSDKITLTARQQKIIQQFPVGEWVSAGLVAEKFPDVSAATLRRDLAELVGRGVLEREGEKKGAKYAITERSRLFLPFTLGTYYEQDTEDRNAQTTYNFAAFSAMGSASLFTSEQDMAMRKATRLFHDNAQGLSPTLYQKELERFVIEFSWKSSKIEGNTYSLLDTEFLLRNGLEAAGKSKHETKMILNHKNAYLFIVESIRDGVTMDVAYIEQVHHLVTEGLGVERGLRNRLVGISGSVYTPLAMKRQLHEQLATLTQIIAQKESAYEQALIAVLGLSYLQPFEDGNKRTARVLANSLLLRAGYAPLSYRSIGEREYKEATLIFYEQNSVVPFRELFVEQYVYSATHYNLGRS